MNNLSTLLVVALASVAMAFTPVPSSHQRLQQQISLTDGSSSSPSCVILEMGSRGATKWEKKKEWLRSRGMSDEDLDESTSTGNPMTPVNIIIAGAPASGKGTQCEIIKEEFGVVHLSTGDMLRAAVSAGTDVGVKAKEFMDAGKLVPDEVIIGIIIDRLAETDCKEQGWLLDGFPRTAAQAEALADAGVSADCFIFLDVPDEILVERVVGRRTDPETGKIYHMTFSPPSEDETEVIARLEHRSDDTEEKVVVRLEQFHSNVAAVKGSYEEIMVAIDGNRSPSDVSEEVMDSIKSALAKRTQTAA
jgi:adenylate kinase